MNSQPIIIPDELGRFIDERQRIWADVNKSQSHAAELNQLSSAIPNCAPAQLQSSFTKEQAPPTELASVLAALKNELANISNLGTEIMKHQAEIEEIRKRDKSIITALVVAAVVMIIILIAVISS